MFFLSLAKLKSVFLKRKYVVDVTKKYDSYMEVLNNDSQVELTIDVFHEFGIYSLKDLGCYLKKNAEYGGYVRVPWSKNLILIPFHNDFMNSWLRFDNPRVISFYDKLYENKKQDYDSRIHFNMKRFDIEEELQLNNWFMPKVDKKMLTVPISGCWDRTELIARFLELQGFKTKRLSCHDDYIMRGHCFTVYFDGEYWRTTSSFPINLKCREYDLFCKILYKILRHAPIYSDNSKCKLVEFGAPTEGMSTKEYLENIEKGIIVVAPPIKKRR